MKPKEHLTLREVVLGLSSLCLMLFLAGFFITSIAQVSRAYRETSCGAWELKLIIQEWIDTAKEEGRVIPEPKGRLIYA